MDMLMHEKHPPSPVARLASLLDSLFHSQPITPDVREWLIKSFLHYLHHGGEYPLDRFLCLAPIDAGTTSLSTRLGLLKRNLHLAAALRSIALDESVTGWGRCQRLAGEIKKFEGRLWKLYRQLPEPPNNWPEWQQDLFRAYQTGVRIPRTAHGLYAIVNQIDGVSFNAPGVKLLASLTRLQSK
ncbi:MAG: hypothetical protein A3J49_04380 [Gallionellales bacterium RIFCSPHIGHO2_02_FULL_57_16]|nr:MAG: hypothetical protein A3J49_04380 [Gallionellales bacterium RIFCSPHIGHO2_02_FULL_57_16]